MIKFWKIRGRISYMKIKNWIANNVAVNVHAPTEDIFGRREGQVSSEVGKRL